MFRKVLITSTILAMTATSAFAGGHYKGEMSPSAEPCATYNPMLSPYIGLSIFGKDVFSSRSPSYHGLGGTLSVGYGGIVSSNWYLAGEGFVDALMKAGTVNTLKNTWNYGLSVLPGYRVTDNLLGYLRLGAIESRFSAQNKWKAGWQAGLGGQTNIAPNWDLRAEYVYTNYSNVSSEAGSVKSNAVSLGFIYRIT